MVILGYSALINLGTTEIGYNDVSSLLTGICKLVG